MDQRAEQLILALFFLQLEEMVGLEEMEDLVDLVAEEEMADVEVLARSLAVQMSLSLCWTPQDIHFACTGRDEGA